VWYVSFSIHWFFSSVRHVPTCRVKFVCRARYSSNRKQTEKTICNSKLAIELGVVIARIDFWILVRAVSYTLTTSGRSTRRQKIASQFTRNRFSSLFARAAAVVHVLAHPVTLICLTLIAHTLCCSKNGAPFKAGNHRCTSRCSYVCGCRCYAAQIRRIEVDCTQLVRQTQQTRSAIEQFKRGTLWSFWTTIHEPNLMEIWVDWRSLKGSKMKREWP
jgi:hypothetical protein